MATELLDVFPIIQELNSGGGGDDVYTPSFPRELQAIEDHLFNFESDPLFSALTRSVPCSSSSSSSSTTTPPFLLDLSYFDPFILTNQPETTPTTKPAEEQCVAEQDVCEAFLNDDYAFGPISPNECPPTDTAWKPSDADTLQPKAVKKHKTEVGTPAREQNEEDDEEEDVEMMNHKRGGTLNCKNLVSERNRRKRLSQQLLALRALVPNITKMDKRSVLVDALSYLRNIHEETARLQKEIKQQQQQQHPRSMSDMKESNLDNPSGTLRLPRISASPPTPKLKPQITEIDTEKIEDKRYVVKIRCRGGGGLGGDVLRVFELLDFDITYTSLQQLKPQELLITVFIRVRKQGKMTEDKLKDCISNVVLRSGITLQNP